MITFKKSTMAALVVAGIGILPLSAHAVTVTDVGSAGLPGADGITGNPGSPGDDGGNSIADAGFTIPNTDLNNSATATAGAGGSGGAAEYPLGGVGGKGGNAMALATTTAINNDASATANANGGNGGDLVSYNLTAAANGGDATSNASGTVSGTGQLTITSNATGGASSNPWGGQNPSGGFASALASGANEGNQAVNVTSTAKGGVGANGGYANASAFATGSSSGGGAVTVTANQYGGNGGVGGVGGVGSGGDSFMNNATTGFTTGSLSLNQNAFGGSTWRFGGDGGNATSTLVRNNDLSSYLTVNSSAIGGGGDDSDFSGNGGNTSSIVAVTNTGGRAIVSSSNALAGNAGCSQWAPTYCGFSGQAMSSNTTISNGDGNNINASGMASGYVATSSTQGIANGDSIVNVSDTATITFGPNTTASSIAVGSNTGKSSVNVTSTANGGRGNQGDNITGILPLSTDRAGDAIASANGSSSGGGAVTVSANSYGGSGVDSADRYSTTRIGGNASASAIGSNLGDGQVYVTSTANGGDGGENGYWDLGGSAVSYSSANSKKGYAHSSATANSGLWASKFGVDPGIASAHAQANGGVGSQANALATAPVRPWGTETRVPGTSFKAQTSVGVTSAGTSDAIAVIGQSTPSVSAAGKEAVAYGIAAPIAEDVSATLAGHSAVDSNFHNGIDSQILLMGTMSVLNTSLASGLHDYHSLLNLDIDTSSVVNPQSILIGLLNPSWGTNNFLTGNTDSLTFSYSVTGAGGSFSHSYVFNSTNINDAANLFNDTILNLGALTDVVTSTNKYLNLAFNLDLQTGVIGAGLNLGLIAGVTFPIISAPPAAVPLPTAIWLFGSGLVGLLSFTRRKNKTANLITA